MLVAFHSSPFSAPLHAAAATSPLRGFELDVDVIFADSDSLDYARWVTRTSPRRVTLRYRYRVLSHTERPGGASST